MAESSKHELDAPPWLRVESTLMSAARGIRRAYDLRLEALGLNLSKAILLARTQESGPIMQAELAKQMGVGRAAMGSLIDSLEKRGWVERRASSCCATRLAAGPVASDPPAGTRGAGSAAGARAPRWRSRSSAGAALRLAVARRPPGSSRRSWRT